MALNKLEIDLLRNKYGINPLGINQPTKQPAEKQTFLQDAGSDIMQIGTDIKKSTLNRADKVQQSLNAGVSGDQGALETTAQIIGQGAGWASDMFGDIFKGVIKSALPQEAEDVVKSGLNSVITPVVQSDLVKGIIGKYNSLDEKTKRDIDAGLGLGSLALDVATLGGGKKAGELALKEGVKGATKTAELATKATEGVLKTVKPAIETTGKIATGTKDIAEATIKNLAQIPSRIATNVAETKLTTEAIKKLPTKIAKDAVQNGVGLDDVKYLYKIPATQKEPIKQLFKATKDFVSGASKTNPIEIVGKPIVQRITKLKSELGKVGQKLGKTAETLGTITTKELYPEVFNSLKKVAGLNGLKVNKKGLLDFTDTVLSSAETLADRKAIQRIFTDAIKAGTGKQKHLLRQELFEVLGGKKGALTAMTATQDKAYQAIRQGLSNILDTKNSAYKALNSQYSKIVRPLNDISKFMKLNKLADATEDILNMDAGLLARRLTSNASSNPEIRNLFRSLDKATKTTGKTTLNVEALQDFYNLLDKYYDIAGKTTLQGQVQKGVEKASGIKDIITQTAGQIAGKTDAVKMKALENILNEILR